MPTDDRTWAALRQFVERATRTISRRTKDVNQARGYSELLAVLHELTVMVTAERDQAIAGVLAAGDTSHAALATELGVSRQRIDQLAIIAADGGRTRTAPGIGARPATRRRRR